MSRSAAFDLFADSRHSLPHEQQLYRQMLDDLSVPLGWSIFDMNKYEPYHIQYRPDIGYVDCPDWLQYAVWDELVYCNLPNAAQDIWDLNYSLDEVPTFTVVKTGKQFRMGGAPIRYEDVYESQA